MLSQDYKSVCPFYVQMETQSVRTLQKKRTSNFREDETKLLIQLWGSPFIQNKLYLTHRKAPVMRILAANMQQRGFYRTPDEIKTRIRNLKCLYHRIKRSMACGTGLGTVDPDWPHFKAMDTILSKEGIKRMERPEESILEGPRCEDIKQEIDIDINDDLDSWATNDSVGSETSEDPPPLPALKPAPTFKNKVKETESQAQTKQLPTIVPSFTIPTQNFQATSNNSAVKTGGVPSIPLPLLILNSLQPQHTGSDKKNGPLGNSANYNDKISSDTANILKQILEVQKENLDLEKQRLEMEKQRLEFNRVVGSQLLTLVPIIGGLLQHIAFSPNHELFNSAANSNGTVGSTKNGRKRQNSDDIDILKDSKILRTVLEHGIKKYMLGDDNENNDDDKDSDNEDNIQIDDNSSSSK